MLEDMWAYRAVLQDHRALILSDELRRAFDLFVECARTSSRYECIPTFYGSTRIIRYRDLRKPGLREGEPADATFPLPNETLNGDWHIAARCDPPNKRWRPRAQRLPHVVLSLIAFGRATPGSLHAAVDAAVVEGALEGSHRALGIMEHLASKRGCSFTCRDGLVTATTPMLSLDAAEPFELHVGEEALQFFLTRFGIECVGGRQHLAEQFALHQGRDGGALIDVLSERDARTVQDIVFGESSARSLPIGRPYTVVGIVPGIAHPEPFTVDPKVIDRGNQGHASTQDALAAFLAQQGLSPRSPATNEPDFDLAWSSADRAFVAEVKSITADNEEHQLRLGLGQVLRYRYELASKGRDVTAVLVPESMPSDHTWVDLCASLGVILVWPEVFDELVATEPDATSEGESTDD